MTVRRRIRAALKRIKIALEPMGYRLANVIYSIIRRSRPKLDAVNVGINFIGYAKGELGLGQAMRSMAFASKAVGFAFVVRQFAVRMTSKQTNLSLDCYASNCCQYPINLICVNPDMLYRLPFWVKYSEWAKTYNIGYWFWELENFPKAWQYATQMVDEVWVATEFIAQAMRKSGKKVVKIPFPLEFDLPPEHLNKKYFGINPNEFTFIFSFDFNSVPERKNPQATVKAFKEAFPDKTSAVRLILKTMNGGHYSKFREYLEQIIDGDPRIEIRDEYLTQDEMRGLVRSCDCYVSLHRAEGLGLGLAEAMYLGRAVIATGYSGNLEFMNENNSLLVAYEFVPVPPGNYPNGDGQKWAEPDIDHAAQCMRTIATNKALKGELEMSAKATIHNNHSYAKVGSEISLALRQIKSP